MPDWMPPTSCASTRSTEPTASLSASMPSAATFCVGFVGVAVAGGGAGFHGGETPHAAVLFVKFPADFHDLARRLGAAGKQPAANHRVRQRQRFDDVAGFRDAAVGHNRDALFRSGAGADVKRRELRNAHARHDARGADRTGSLADFDGVRAAPGEIFDARRAGDVAGDDGQLRKRVAEHLHRVAHALAVAVCGGNRHRVHAALHQPADVIEDALAVEFAEGVARGATPRRRRRAGSARRAPA